MERLVPFRQDRRWLWTSVIGLLLFLLIQVFPVTGQLFLADVHPVITRAEAEGQALEIAAAKFGIQPNAVDKATVTHLSDSDTVGYLSKHQLMNTYDKQWSSATPTDIYMVELQLKGNAGVLRLSLHMETGNLVAWQQVGGSEAVNDNSANPNAAKPAAHALSYAEFWGINPEDWEWSGIVGEDHSLRFNSLKGGIGESNLWLRIVVPAGFDPSASSFPPWSGGSITYGVDLPDSYSTYIQEQDKWSSGLSIFGFIVPSLIFFILSVVYAGTHGKLTSFRRGIFLSSLFLILYAGITINMVPGLRAGIWGSEAGHGTEAVISVAVVSIIIYAVMALFTYFSAVAGDGLWKSMKRSLWPRWAESDYGARVLQSMREGYFLAFILLGAQSVTLLILENLLGSFSSSDTSQSMYNMSIPWILPLLAWCAGISEELQSRLFGIGLFRKWFVGGASKLLRRQLSHRTTIVLTAAAMIPPGLLWAMGHVGYAIYPVYTRLIELVLMGMLFGWFMLRFGIMTVIFAHVTLDAMLMGMQMMFDGLPGDFFAGIFSLIMPGIVGIVIWWLHGIIQGNRKAIRF